MEMPFLIVWETRLKENIRAAQFWEKVTNKLRKFETKRMLQAVQENILYSIPYCVDVGSKKGGKDTI